MARGINRLTTIAVARAKLGMHSDGGGLWLRVQPNGRAWLFRYKSPTTGRERRMGLGSAQDVTLAAARDLAGDARKLLLGRSDPLDQRAVMAAERERELITFRKAAEACIEAKRAGWGNEKHAAQWTATLEAHVYKRIGTQPVASITKSDVLEILSPIWQTIPETAGRVRGRIETILDYAKQRDWRAGENPAAWKGNLQHALAHRSKVAQVEHHAALPWQRISEVMAKLAKSEGTGALAVQFTALTAVRPTEARGVLWSEIDLEGKVWTIPGARMKAGREHRVPLSTQALAILALAKERAVGDVVFPGGRAGGKLSDVAVSKALHVAAGTKAVTVHGLRSTFRDWVADATSYQSDVAEAALAHALGDAVRVAYQRGDLFEKRRGLMKEWGAYIESD